MQLCIYVRISCNPWVRNTNNNTLIIKLKNNSYFFSLTLLVSIQHWISSMQTIRMLYANEMSFDDTHNCEMNVISGERGIKDPKTSHLVQLALELLGNVTK